MITAPFPILTTERLTLRQLSIDDHLAIYDLRSDPNSNKFLDRPLCQSTEEAKNFIYKINDNIKKGGAYYWAITLTNTQQLVGTICLFDFSNQNNSCEIGYELLTKFQGQGLMLEAVQIVINFVFQSLKCKKILAYTHLENQQSTHLLLKLNFIKSIEVDKENPNLVLYSLTP